MWVTGLGTSPPSHDVWEQRSTAGRASWFSGICAYRGPPLVRKWVRFPKGGQDFPLSESLEKEGGGGPPIDTSRGCP